MEVRAFLPLISPSVATYRYVYVACASANKVSTCDSPIGVYDGICVTSVVGIFLHGALHELEHEAVV